MSHNFIKKFKKHYDVDDRLDNPKEWLIINSVFDIELPISEDIKNIWFISDGESHYGFGELFSEPFENFKGKIYFSGNYKDVCECCLICFLILDMYISNFV